MFSHLCCWILGKDIFAVWISAASFSLNPSLSNSWMGVLISCWGTLLSLALSSIAWKPSHKSWLVYWAWFVCTSFLVFFLLSWLDDELPSFVGCEWARISHVLIVILCVGRYGITLGEYWVSIWLKFSFVLWSQVASWHLMQFQIAEFHLSLHVWWRYITDMFVWYLGSQVWCRCMTNNSEGNYKWDGYGAYLGVFEVGWSHVAAARLGQVCFRLYDSYSRPGMSQRWWGSMAC